MRLFVALGLLVLVAGGALLLVLGGPGSARGGNSVAPQGAPDGPGPAERAALATDEPGRSRDGAGLRALPAAPSDSGDAVSAAAGAALLEPARDAVYGQVLDANGAPAEGALVRLLPALERKALNPRWVEFQAGRLAGWGTNADGEGRFRFEGLEPWQSCALAVDYRGHLHEARLLQPGTRQEIRLQTRRDVQGRVVDDRTGEPLAGVWLRESPGWFDFGEDAWRAARSDETGRFRLDWIPVDADQVKLLVHAPASLPVALTLPLPASPGAPLEVRLDLAEARTLELLDAVDGLPLAGVEVAHLLAPGLPEERLRSDGAGRVVLRAALDGARPPARTSEPAAPTIRLRVPGRCPTEVRIDGSWLERSVPVPLLRSVPLAGRIVDPEGRPAARYFVFAETREATTDPEPPAHVTWESGWTVTDGAGRFSLEILPWHGTIELELSGPREHEVRQELALPLEEPALELVVDVPRPAIRGRVTLDGEPVRTAVSWATAEGGGSDTSNDLGEYVLYGVPPGPAELSVGTPPGLGLVLPPPVPVMVPREGVLERDLELTGGR